MQLNKPVFIVIMVLSVAIAGFAAGSFAGAYMLGEPGTELDPLVAESYVKEAVEQTTAELKEQIVALQEQIEELRDKLDGLEARGTAVSSAASRSQREQPKPQGNTIQNTTNSNNTNSTNERATVVTPEPGKTALVLPEAGANLRTGPNTEYDRVTTVAQGSRLEIIAEKQGWYEVKLENGTKGWIFGELIKRD